MADDVVINRRIDALVIEPPDEALEHRAAANVCTIMNRAGHTNQQIREVLAALGLLTGVPRR